MIKLTTTRVAIHSNYNINVSIIKSNFKITSKNNNGESYFLKKLILFI